MMTSAPAINPLRARRIANLPWQVAIGLASMVLILVTVDIAAVVGIVHDRKRTLESEYERAQVIASTDLFDAALGADISALRFVITGNDAHKHSYEAARRGIARNLVRIDILNATDHALKVDLGPIRPLLSKRLATLEQAVTARGQQGSQAALTILANEVAQERNGALFQAIAAQRALLREAITENVNAIRARTSAALYVLVGASLLGWILLLLSWYSVRHESRQRHAANLQLAEVDSRLRALLAASTEVSIIACDLSGTAILFNPGAEKMLGYRADEVVDKLDVMKLHVESEIEVRGRELSRQLGRPVKGLERCVALAMEGRPDEYECTYVRKDGSQLTVSLCVTAVHDETGGINAFLGIAKDITAHKAAEQRLHAAIAELREANKRALTADRTKSMFLATISHELRTPLNAIIGFTGIILEGLAGPLNDEQRKQLEMVSTSSHHLLTLINDLLDISKIEAQQMELIPTPFNLRDSINKVAAISKPLADKSQLALTTSVSDTVSTVIGDQRRIEQVLLNLVSNAIKFTQQGSVDMAVDSVDDFRENDAAPTRSMIRVRISDTGIGMSPEQLDQLFKPFHQVDSSLSRRHEGTGLGLAISRHLARLMHGDIQVESRPHHGSTFTFTFPVQ